MNKKIAVVLTGAGYLDGSEITEAVSTLICLSEAKVNYQCYAPEITFTSTNHYNKTLEGERSTFSESARICRGQLKNLAQLNSKEYDGLVIPGGFGSAFHLSNWAKKAHDCEIREDISNIILKFHEESKPIAGICISPVLIAKVLGKYSPTLTIGNNKATADSLEKLGAIHENTPVDDYISDRDNKILSTPAYMYDDSTAFEVFSGIRKMLIEFIEMA